MSNPQTPPPVKLFVGIIFSELANLESLYEKLKNEFGPIDFTSEIYSFTHSNYYKKEMGDNLKRQFITFEKLVFRDDVYPAKNVAFRLEELFKDSNKNRTINIDPGFISLENLVLLTYKGFSHRIYVRGGIWGDLTLIYKNNSYRSLEWTYGDYKDRIDLFNKLRQSYFSQLKGIKI